jgi:hypothetical protein
MSRRVRDHDVADVDQRALPALLRSRQGDLRSAIQTRRGAIQRKNEGASTQLGVSTPLTRLSSGDAAPLRRDMDRAATRLAGRLRAGRPETMLSGMFDRLNAKLAEGSPDTISGTDSTDAPFGAVTLRWTGRMSLRFEEIEISSMRDSEGESTSTESDTASNSTKTHDQSSRDRAAKRSESETVKRHAEAGGSDETGASAEVPVEGVPVKVDTRRKLEGKGGIETERNRSEEQTEAQHDERSVDRQEDASRARTFGAKASGEGANVGRALRCTVNWELSYQLPNEDGFLASAANLVGLEAREGRHQDTSVLTPKGTHARAVERDPSRTAPKAGG